MDFPRNILIACDKFKGSLEATAVCEAIARGLSLRYPKSVIQTRPIADGGEGFMSSLAKVLDGRWIETSAEDALGRRVDARYWLADTAEGPLAVIEMAEASGMWRIRPEERDILRSSTYGTGSLMRHAVVGHGVTRLLIGLGGSATNDGGAGMAAALGVRFVSAAGTILDPTPAALSGQLARIDMNDRILLPPVTAACVVSNPLLGMNGASRVFGPQKGADDASMPVLESVLADIVRCSEGAAAAVTPGAGAAGGLGFGLLRFAGATLVPGFDLLASLTGLEALVAAADLVVTGEGSLDSQSLSGKGPVALALLAHRFGKPVIAFCGRVDADVESAGCFDRIIELRATGLPIEDLMSGAAGLLEQAASSLPAWTRSGLAVSGADKIP
jgi:glycerate kinase